MSGLEIFVANHPFLAYAILFGGMFIEGEVIFLMAAIFAWHNYLSWFWVAVLTLAGVFFGDVIWYLLGKNLDKIPFIRFLLKIKFSNYHQWLDQNFIKRYSRMAFFQNFCII